MQTRQRGMRAAFIFKALLSRHGRSSASRIIDEEPTSDYLTIPAISGILDRLNKYDDTIPSGNGYSLRVGETGDYK